MKPIKKAEIAIVCLLSLVIFCLFCAKLQDVSESKAERIQIEKVADVNELAMSINVPDCIFQYFNKAYCHYDKEIVTYHFDSIYEAELFQGAVLFRIQERLEK